MDERKKPNFQPFTPPHRRGAPRSETPRRTTTITLPEDVLIALDTYLGSLSRSAFIEQLIRQSPEISQHLKQQRP
jgi:hypothetical protein